MGRYTENVLAKALSEDNLGQFVIEHKDNHGRYLFDTDDATIGLVLIWCSQLTACLSWSSYEMAEWFLNRYNIPQNRVNIVDIRNNE